MTSDFKPRRWTVFRKAADELLRHRLPAGHLPVVGVSGLDNTGQGTLFDGEEREKQSLVDAVADQIKERFGAAPSGGVARWAEAGASPSRPFYDMTISVEIGRLSRILARISSITLSGRCGHRAFR